MEAVNILGIKNVIDGDMAARLRADFDRLENLAVRECNIDEYSDINRREKLYDSGLAAKVTVDILTRPELIAASKPLNDYSWRMYFNGFADRFETAISKYPAGGFYRWHTDHTSLRRLLVFIVFLSEEVGGNLEICTAALDNDFLKNGGHKTLDPEFICDPEIGKLIMFPSYYPHRVRSCTADRYVMHGHVCLGQMQ